MSPDEARALFSAAFDNDLDEGQRRQFDAALEADPDLSSDYASFCRALSVTRTTPEPLEPDVLSGVQERLRKRSRGRFYADRFAQRRGRSIHPLTVAIVTIVILAMTWVSLYLMERLQVLVPG